MAGLDMSRVRALQTELDTKGDPTIILSSKMPAELDIRLMPPADELNGSYFVVQKQWWINKKPYQSNSTFGSSDVIADEIKKAEALNDPDIAALLSGQQAPSAKDNYIMAVKKILIDNNGDVKAIDSKVKFLSCTKMLATAINKEVCSRWVQPDITDRKKGFNITCVKEGQALSTEYTAKHWPTATEMPADLYEELDNPMDYLRTEKVSDTYLRGVIRNYIYGEPMPKQEDKHKDGATTSTRRGAAPVDEDDAPAPKRRFAAEEEEAPAPKKRRVVEEEEEAPAPRRRAAVVEEEEETHAPKKKAVAPPFEADEPAPKKRNPVMDMMEDDDDEA